MAKGRKWISIVAKDFKDAVLGETFGDNVVGRKVVVNLMNVLNNPRRQNVNLVFKISEVRDNKAIAEVIGYRILSSYIKKSMRLGIDKVEDSFLVECKDSKLKIKPYVLVMGKVYKSVLTGIRKSIEEFLKNEVKDKNFNEVIFSIVDAQIQTKLKKILHKVYPVGLCEFRIVEKV